MARGHWAIQFFPDYSRSSTAAWTSMTAGVYEVSLCLEHATSLVSKRRASPVLKYVANASAKMLLYCISGIRFLNFVISQLSLSFACCVDTTRLIISGAVSRDLSLRCDAQNAAMFPIDDPTSPPLIGPSTIVVVNDARHQLQPEFLQRTTPYFFDVDTITGQYKWAKVRLPFPCYGTGNDTFLFASIYACGNAAVEMPRWTGIGYKVQC